jgi:hypothetical protein
LEAELWKELGIQPDHGWLIERGRTKSRALIAKMGYNLCTSLNVFPKMVASVLGSDGLDSFHLDLCGTIHPDTQALEEIIPLLRRTKVLAITVADQRRNLQVENFVPIQQAIIARLGGRRFRALVRRLRSEQHAIREAMPAGYGSGIDLDKAVKRELVVFARVLQALGGAQVSGVERFVYRGTNSFRMRTYILQLQAHRAATASQASEALLLTKQWVGSPLVIVKEGAMQSLQIAPQAFRRKPMTSKKAVTGSTDAVGGRGFAKLAAIATAVGGEVLDEFNAIMAELTEYRARVVQPCSHEDLYRHLAELGQLAQKTLDSGENHFETALSGVGNTVGSNGHSIKDVPETDSSFRAPRGRPRNRSEIEILIDLMKARVNGKAAYVQARSLAIRDLKLGKEGDAAAKKRIGMKYARTQGEKFRGQFVKRAVNGTKGLERQRMLGDLALIYNQLEGAQHTADGLALEAGLN